MTPHIATIRIKMPQNGTRERLLSSRNLSTKDLSASAPVVNEVVLEGVFSEAISSILHRLPLGAATRPSEGCRAGTPGTYMLWWWMDMQDYARRCREINK